MLANKQIWIPYKGYFPQIVKGPSCLTGFPCLVYMVIPFKRYHFKISKPIFTIFHCGKWNSRDYISIHNLFMEVADDKWKYKTNIKIFIAPIISLYSTPPGSFLRFLQSPQIFLIRNKKSIILPSLFSRWKSSILQLGSFKFNFFHIGLFVERGLGYRPPEEAKPGWRFADFTLLSFISQGWETSDHT